MKKKVLILILLLIVSIFLFSSCQSNRDRTFILHANYLTNTTETNLTGNFLLKTGDNATGNYMFSGNTMFNADSSYANVYPVQTFANVNGQVYMLREYSGEEMFGLGIDSSGNFFIQDNNGDKALIISDNTELATFHENVAVTNLLTAETGTFSDAKGSTSINGDGISLNNIVVTSSYSALSTDHTIMAKCSEEDISITLPSCREYANMIIRVKNLDSDECSINIIGTIDESTNYALTTQYESITLQCSSVKNYDSWWILSKYDP